jgi:hypothetical protein
MAATRNFRRSKPPLDGEAVRRTTYVQFLPSKKRLKNISAPSGYILPPINTIVVLVENSTRI